MFNTDQGVQFTAAAFTGRLESAGVAVSMDGRGRALDNVFVERLWRSVKYEDIYLRGYETVPELQRGLGRYFAFYNDERLHQSLDYRTPAAVYRESQGHEGLTRSSEGSPFFGLDNGVHLKPYDLARIQNDLPEDTALVAWLDITGRSHAVDPNGEHWACIVRKRREPTWVKMTGTGPQGQWTDADDRLPQRVYDTLFRLPEDPTAWWDVARKFAAQRLAPLQKDLGVVGDLPAVRHLIVLPSWWTLVVPLEALIEAQPKDSPRYHVSYTPSGTMFAWLQEQRWRKRRGDQAYLPRLLALYQPAGEDPPLHFTRLEVLGITEHFDSEHQVVLSGADASEQRLDAMARDGRLSQFESSTWPRTARWIALSPCRHGYSWRVTSCPIRWLEYWLARRSTTAN